MKPTLIGISGKKGSGKDLLARTIAENLDDQVYCTHFAAPIKKFVEEISGVNMKCQEYGPFVNPVLDFAREDKDKYLDIYGTTIGEFMQIFGEDMRDSNDLTFIESVRIKAIKAASKGYITMVPDVRYINEAEFIRDMGGIIIRLEGGHPDSRNEQHESEVQLDNYTDFSFTATMEEGQAEKLALKVIKMFGL